MTLNIRKPLQIIAMIVLTCSCLCMSEVAFAADKPAWARSGEKSLNKEKSNDHYRFKVFNTHTPLKPSGENYDVRRHAQVDSLCSYIRQTYALPAMEEVAIDSLTAAPDWVVTFRTAPDSLATVYVRPVDEYTAYEDYADNIFEYETWQLYAITDPGYGPEVFDCFSIVPPSNAKAAALSIVPGLGQLYKGHDARGYVFFGGEVALVTCAVVFNHEYRYCRRMEHKEPDVADSWHKKSNSWRTFRNGAICLAAGLYVWNILDAALSDGAPRVKVTPAKGVSDLALTPVAYPDGAGLALTFSF